MENEITIREAESERDAAAFWDRLRDYHERDMFPDPEDEDRAYFLGPEYRARLQKLHGRPHDRLRRLFFCRDGRDIGFAMPVIYDTEDGKCFLLEFGVFPEHRGSGTGTRCAAAFLAWARANGAAYVELNCHTAQRRRFWSRLGFVPNGRDEWGAPLLLLPPEQRLPLTVERLTDPEDWQLRKLENGFLAEIGEESLSDEKRARLQAAIEAGEITFFLARRGYRAVGLCSVARCFSTFACAGTGVFDDFYVEPAFRRQGAARLLAEAARDWCRAQGLASLTVSCAPCDEAMYRALGFDTPLGLTLARTP